MAGEVMSFDEAMRELEVGADELERLVAENEIPAIHDGDTVVFKREVVQEYKKNRQTRPTIILQSDTDAGEPEAGSASTDETVLNIEGLMEDDLEEPTAAGSEEIRVGAVEDEPVLDTGVLEEDEDTAAFDLVAEEDTLLDEEIAPAAGPTSRAMQVRRREASPGLMALAVATTVVMLGPAIIILNLQEGVFPRWIEESLTVLNPVVDGILSLF